MAVSIDRVFEKTKEKYRLSLIAGKGGMSHYITWIYILEDVTIADFIRGGELIITTGLGLKTEDDFYHMTEVLIKQKASGIIVNVGNYIKKIPQKIIDLCNQENFPLFIMPWEIHIVDISQQYCNFIIQDKQKQINLSDSFYNILFQPDKADISLVKKLDYELSGLYCVLIVSIPDTFIHADQEETEQYFEFEFLSKINAKVKKCCGVIEENKYIIILQLNDKDMNEIEGLLKKICRTHSFESEKLGVGSIQESIHKLKKTYQHALSAFMFADAKSNQIVFYEKLGIYKILTEVKDMEVLEDMVLEYLGPIIEYDKIHRSEYLETLRLYLDYNSSIIAVAEKSFNHRNTINYRMKKIKSLLNKNLEDTRERFMLQFCYKIMDMLQKKI